MVKGYGKKIVDKYILVYIYILSCIIPGVSDYGISIADGIKMSIVDILALLIIITFLLKKDSIKKIFLSFRHNKNSIKVLASIAIYVLFYGYISIFINDISAIRIVRNIFLVLFDYLVLNYMFCNEDENKIVKKLMLLGIVASVANIYQYKKRYDLSQSYDLFRSNETLLVSLFVFFIFYIMTNKFKLSKNIHVSIVTVLILIALITQQERTEIIAFAVTFILLFLYYIFFYKERLKIAYIIKSIIFIFIVLAIFVYFYNNNDFLNGLVNNYIKNRINIIYSNHSFNKDTSLSTRSSEFVIIGDLMSKNILSFFCGRGLLAQYCLNGVNTFTVDSFWLWIFLDMGVIGVLIFSIFFVYIIFNIFKIKSRYKMPVLGFCIATIVMTLFTPNFIWRLDDGLSFAILMAITFRFKTFKS
ncbi:O-antigen ligase family protein [Clostridium hydrogenum]|uniref:O-antigen ligase family protein n=1 Tax=Clostridium hydrogenum TaxID=2855764 RepID=UPI002E331503|nr:O-antigen ligase family protein [Clostridium hydrogenum]